MIERFYFCVSGKSNGNFVKLKFDITSSLSKGTKQYLENGMYVGTCIHAAIYT